MSKRPFEEEDPTPEDLPEAKHKPVEGAPANAMAAARKCGKCGSTSIRIVSNYAGHRAICNECKDFWSLSMQAPVVVSGSIYDRGLSRRTIASPNFDLAFEDLDEIFDPKNKDK